MRTVRFESFPTDDEHILNQITVLSNYCIVTTPPFKNATQRHTHYANSQTSQTSQPLRYVTHATAATPQPLCYRCHPRRHPCNTHIRLRSSRQGHQYCGLLCLQSRETQVCKSTSLLHESRRGSDHTQNTSIWSDQRLTPIM